MTDPTPRWLVEAGIRPGMRVLEAGCGLGSVTGMLLDLVGADGAVTALDRDLDLLASAAKRHAGRNATFLPADLNGALPDLGTFDAVVTRRVLMYVRDPAASLRALARAVEGGGIIFVQDLHLPPASTGLPLHDELSRRLRATLAFEGAGSGLGPSLPGVFRDAGLPFPTVRAEVEVVAPGAPDSLSERTAYLVPRMNAAGVRTDDLDLDSLAARLRQERDDAGRAWLAEIAVAAWANKA